MATLWQLYKAHRQIEKRAKEIAQREADRFDKDLPLDLRVGGKVRIDPVSTTAFADLLLVEPTKSIDFEIIGFSKAQVFGVEVFNFQLETEDEENAYLWVCKHKDGELEARFFRQHDEVYPQDADEWSLWLKRFSGLIGGDLFNISVEGHPTGEDFVFARSWVPGDDYVSPLEYRENFFPDPYEKHNALILAHQAMLYVREIKPENKGFEPFNEYVFVSAVGCGNEAFVTINVGVDLSVQTDITKIDEL